MPDELDLLIKRMYDGGIFYHEAVREFQKVFVSSALREHKGNLTKAAPRLGVHRNTLTRMIAQLELDMSSFRCPPTSVAHRYPDIELRKRE